MNRKVEKAIYDYYTGFYECLKQALSKAEGTDIQDGKRYKFGETYFYDFKGTNRIYASSIKDEDLFFDGDYAVFTSNMGDATFYTAPIYDGETIGKISVWTKPKIERRNTL